MKPMINSKGLCYSYFFNEFNLYPSVLSINNNEYLKHISDFHDPILIYVALYLYDNYKIAQNFFNQISKKGHNVACYVLNRWLDQQKSFYTHFEKCQKNKRWWDISIEPLWEKLQGYYPHKECERFKSYYDTSKIPYNMDVKDLNYQLIPEDNILYKENDDGNSLQENCTKLSILFYLGEKYKLLGENTNEQNNTDNKYCLPNVNLPYEKINYNPVLKAEKSYFCESLINKIALPISVTVLGTIFLTFFLSEFTPIGSILRTPSINKARLRKHFNEEAAYEEYKTHRKNNQNTPREKNIIYYQSKNE